MVRSSTHNIQIYQCIICKILVDLDDEILTCVNCGRPYHAEHLGIWLKIETNCPTCKNDLSKLAFTQFAIQQCVEYPRALYTQLEKIFPKGISKPIMEKYMLQFPEGIPLLRFEELQNRHSKFSDYQDTNIRKNQTNKLKDFEQLVWAYLLLGILSGLYGLFFLVMIQWVLFLGLSICSLYFFVLSYLITRENRGLVLLGLLPQMALFLEIVILEIVLLVEILLSFEDILHLDFIKMILPLLIVGSPCFIMVNVIFWEPVYLTCWKFMYISNTA